MTNDSRLFRRASELQAEGYYPVQGNLYRKRGEGLSFLPLYEGKMVQAVRPSGGKLVAVSIHETP